MSAEQAVDRYRRDLSYARIGCDDENSADLSYLYALGALMAEEARTRELREELEALRTHACRWSSDDYCMDCGADGRA